MVRMNWKRTIMSKIILYAAATTMLILTGCVTKPKSEVAGWRRSVERGDAVVHAERINTSMGLTMGFRVEVGNPSQDKNLVLVVYDNISYLFDVRLINVKEQDISPLQPLRPAVDKRSPNSPKTYRYETILPGTSRAWLIPVPSQVRVDLAKLNENNLAPTPNGEYMAEIKINLTYFMQDKLGKSPPKFPKFQYLTLTLPRIPIRIANR